MRVHHIEAACDLARRHGATVTVNMKRRGNHPMLRIEFGGLTELITVSNTPGKTYALDMILGDVTRALRKLGAIKANGPGQRRRKHKRSRPIITYRCEREPTPVRRTFRDQLRDWKYQNSKAA